jgi:hypothetical protein
MVKETEINFTLTSTGSNYPAFATLSDLALLNA